LEMGPHKQCCCHRPEWLLESKWHVANIRCWILLPSDWIVWFWTKIL